MSGAPAEAATQAHYRLPTDVKPKHYDVTIRTDLEESKFDGIVRVDLDVLKETDTIVLHAKELKLAEISLFSDVLGKELSPASSNLDAATGRVTISFASVLPRGSKAQLKLAFEGELTGSMTGYYRSSAGGDSKKYYTLTQFESTYARKAFPCWDEPASKATFSMTMVSRADTVNLNNMPAISETPYEPSSDTVDSFVHKKLGNVSGKWKITKFDKTPPMSTYLVAFANGHFAYIEDSYKSPISGKIRPLRIYTTPDELDQAHFALEVKKKVLPLYEELFEIEYPLPKLDTLVVHDFDAGAMENWGLITGRTTAFLFDSKKGEFASKKRVATVQSHEVAHMWFGDITTMEWWDNLYLNEGFASLVGEVIILDKVFPDWKLHPAFVSGDLAEAMNLDAKLSSHPIEMECKDEGMIDQIFDSLSYAKAASVLRMLSAYTGEDKFLKGVSIYLKKHLYKNSITRDLWEGIQTATGLDIPRMMDNWVKKIGFPVVTVTETPEGIRVRQDRFLETGPAKPEDNETIWVIPLSLLKVSDKGEVILQKELALDQREVTIPLDTSKHFKLNAGTTGVYRVLYNPERLRKIGEEAAKPASIFTLEDRIGVVNDAFALAKSGHAKLSSALSLINELKNEKEFLVWEGIRNNVAAIASTWYAHGDVSDAFKAFRRKLYGPLAKQLGYDYPEGESVDTSQLRTLVVSAAAGAEDEEVVAELRSRFARYMETGDDSVIPPDLNAIIYTTAVKHGGLKEWEAVREIARKPKTPFSGTDALRALGATRDPKIAEKTVEFTLTEVRNQDLLYPLSGFGQNVTMREFGKEVFKKHYDTIYERLESSTLFRYIVPIAWGNLSSYKDQEEMVEFFKGKDMSKYDMSYKQALENIGTRAAWIERSTDDFREWLTTHQ